MCNCSSVAFCILIFPFQYSPYVIAEYITGVRAVFLPAAVKVQRLEGRYKSRTGSTRIARSGSDQPGSTRITKNICKMRGKREISPCSSKSRTQPDQIESTLSTAKSPFCFLVPVSLGLRQSNHITDTMAVARNLCAGGQARGAPVTPVSRGVWGMLPQKLLKFRTPEMPFPEAISSSYLIQVMIF